MIPSGAFDDRRAPTYTAGRAPIRIEVVSPSWKSPTRMCAIAADATSGTACDEVGAHQLGSAELRIREHQAHDDDRARTHGREPDEQPADRADRDRQAGRGRGSLPSVGSVARSPARACALRRAWSHARKTIAIAASVSVTPRKSLRRVLDRLAVTARVQEQNTPANAAGIEPMQSHFTNSQRTVRRRTWTPPPTGFITIAATRSEDTAAVGLMPKKIRRIGVMSAPPPIPVRPTVKPTMIEARAIPQSMCRRAQLPAAFVLHDLAAEHHERHVLEDPHVVGRVAGNGDQVGQESRRHRAHAVLPPEQLRRPSRRAPDRLHRREPEPDVVREVPRVLPVGVDPGIGPVRDPHARLDALREPLALRVVRHHGLADHLVVVPERGAFLQHVVAVVHVGDEVRPALGHQLDRLVVEQRAVLDRADAGPDGPLDPLRAVRVRGDERAGEPALLDRGAQLVLGELRQPRVRARGQHGAGRDHLDEVGAVAEDLPDVRAHLVHARGDAEPQLVRDDRVDVRRQAGEVAAAAGTGHVRSRAQHPGAGDPPGVDRLTQAPRRRRRGTSRRRGPW